MQKICVVELYEEYFEAKGYLLEKLKEKKYEVSTFSFFDKQTILFPNKKKLLVDELICFLKLLVNFHYFRKKRILCQGGQFSFFLLYKVFGFFLGKDFHLFIYNFYLHAMGKKKIVKYLLKFLLNSKKITLIVQSPGEVEYYKSLNSKCSVIFTPYCQDVNTDIESLSLSPHREYIFSGGYTNRDYPLIIECARLCPKTCFLLIVSHLNLEDFKGDIPSNITLYSDTDREFFYEAMMGSSAVIIPLKEDVGASGQMLCLGAMALSKPIIYTNISSINYYLETDPECGIPYEISSLDSLISAVNTFESYDATKREEMGKNAHDNYMKKYTKNRGLDNLVDIISR